MINIDIRPKESETKQIDFVSPAIAVGGALLVGMVFLTITNNDLITTYYLIFFDPLTDIGGIVSVLNRSIPLALAGLAVYIPYKAGLWNIGVEGQIYVAAIAVSWVGLSTGIPAFVLLPLLIVVGAVAGGLWAFIPGYLRAKWGVNEIIVTLMLTFTAIQLTQYVVRGPLQGSQGFPASLNLPQAGQLPTVADIIPALDGISLNIVFFFVVVVVTLVYSAENRTVFGYTVRVVGSNPNAAEATGISRFWVYVTVLVIGGLLAGIIGTYQTSVVYTRLQPTMSPGYGYSGIPIALLGHNGSFRVFLASLFFAVMFVGGSTAAISTGVPLAILDILQALIILFYIAAAFFKRYKVDITFGSTNSEVV